ncbi:MAG: hypothetical protein J6B44_05335 [Muribaculaceae bacterium]|nr:hypothetical protein [Muribaculaceae bacterium]
MTFKHFWLTGVSAACIFSSCVDDNYDLSDIDTTVRVNVNDLTVPVNLDDILLSSIIEEGDRIKVVNGEYAVTEDGKFESKEVEIPTFTVRATSPKATEFNIVFIPAAIGLLDAGHFDINCPEQKFSFSATEIPSEIVSIDRIGGEIELRFDFSLKGINAVARKIEFRDLEFQLPKGLNITEANGGSYDATTGILTMPEQTTSGEELSIVIKANEVDFKTLGAELDYDKHSVDISGNFYVRSGKISIKREDLIGGTTPTALKLIISYNISDFTLSTFTGKIKYDITGVNISDVDLSDLPDVLNQKGTDIRLANPQIYLSVTNPLQKYKLTANTGLTITSNNGDQHTPYSIDEPYFTIGNGNADGVYTFCLAPSNPTQKPEDFKNAEFVKFSTLGNILSGDGLPQSLSFKLDNPCLPEQQVENLVLGTGIAEISGKYSFLAPIALSNGSKIVYSEKIDDWDTEDLEYMTITKLDVKATITSELPMALDITAYPIDKDGNQINNVEIVGAKLAASSQPQEINIHITGEINKLAGIEFEAVATAGEDGRVLRPDMTIKVSKLRPTVSGYYEKEL